MGFVRKEITVITHMTSLIVHTCSVQVFSVRVLYLQRPCRYEHSKPLKQEEVTAIDLTSKLSLALSSSPSLIVELIIEMNIGEVESRNSNFATIGAG